MSEQPPAVCCPECGRLCDYNEKGKNYPCERCGVLWRWFSRDKPLESEATR